MGYNWAKNTMEKQNKQGETQNRRQFFKEVARKSLPILGAVALMSNPMIAKAVGKETTNCRNACADDCAGRCEGSCYSTCKGTCEGSCLKGCKISCYGSCNDSCVAVSK
ncbi:MAG: Cys-Xaa-Xaa-Xaa repeat radical SAM target protein [Bacteroidales bacterium]|nr:Cys-Xaa-Xaa-Xaa repeat radical SAM target protein [Bacteroidales bacterium]